MDRAVILVSGGVNSAVAAAVAREHYEPAFFHVAWGHRSADRELGAFQQIAAAFDIEKTTVAELSSLALIGGNARVTRRQAIEDAATLTKEIPATFACGLMPSMLSLATAWASSIGATRIILGISEDHGTPGPAVSELYPDHRIEFVQTFNLMLKYAISPRRELTVETPLIELTRAEVVQVGHRLHVPFEHTWSCYANNERPCGRCRPCTTRAAGFIQAKIADPLMLENPIAAS